jgi:hypothetical protein
MQANLPDVRAEGSGAVMILAMHVVRDRSADRNKASSGSNGQEPSLRQKHVDDVGKADAAFAAHHARGFVKPEDAVEATAVDQIAAGVETRVAVAASQSIRKQRTGRGRAENLGT